MTEVTVTLTSDEALVLFELLHRWEDARELDQTLNPGEQIALWALSSRLETILVESFESNYHELVDRARKRLTEVGSRKSTLIAADEARGVLPVPPVSRACARLFSRACGLCHI